MKVFKYVFIGFASVFALVIIYGFTLPDVTTVSRSAVLSDRAENVFAQVNSLKKFSQWSPWRQYDPKMQLSFEGPEQGVGASMLWKSEHPKVGEGSQRISESEVNRYVKMSLTFSGMQNSYAEWFIASHDQSSGAHDGQVNVEWRFTMQHQNVFGRYIGLLMDDMVGLEYEKGLLNLKKHLAKQ